MLVEDISDPFFSSVARIIEENLYSLGYKIFHSSTNNNTLRVKALLRIFRERQVDGYIIVPSPGIENDLQHLLNQSKPVILFDRYFPGLNTSNVVIDNMGGTYKAVQHLVENRFTHIAFITLNSEQVQMVERLRGYDKAMDENRLSKYILKIDYKSAPGKITAVIKTFLERNTSINAVVFATNYLAINGLQAIRELGLSIPANIGVIGFDDNTHFALFSPAITAIAQPVVEISNQAALQLIRELTATEKIREKITAVLPTELIIRESSLQPVVIN
jgi:LacI family transcriptional regulator